MLELNNSNKCLSGINADLDNFVYTTSHNLQLPIFNIKTVLLILNSKIDMKNPDVVKLINIIKAAITNFKEVITDLAKVGQFETVMQE